MEADANLTWQESLRRGGPITVQPSEVESLLAAAKAAGYAVFEADCERAKSKSAVLRAIANAVDYPEYFGSDLDALLDCLTSTVLDQSRGALVVLRRLNHHDAGLAPHVPDILDTFFDASEEVRDNDRVLAYISVA